MSTMRLLLRHHKMEIALLVRLPGPPSSPFFFFLTRVYSIPIQNGVLFILLSAVLTSSVVLANLTLSSEQDTTISNNLKSRWGPYGAPAPECASSPATISPFAGAFELEAHFVAGDPVAALDLMRIEWGDFMLDDPRMTNSTFIEGYSADGSLHYSPYSNDPR